MGKAVRGNPDFDADAINYVKSISLNMEKLQKWIWTNKKQLDGRTIAYLIRHLEYVSAHTSLSKGHLAPYERARLIQPTTLPGGRKRRAKG